MIKIRKISDIKRRRKLKDIKRLIDKLNKLTDNPVRTSINGEFCIGNYFLDRPFAYGYSLCQVINNVGAIKRIFPIMGRLGLESSIRDMLIEIKGRR